MYVYRDDRSRFIQNFLFIANQLALWPSTYNQIMIVVLYQSPSPAYNVSDMRVPMALFTGSKDWLADPRDVAGLLPKLNKTGKLMFHKNIDYYDHFDFIWGIDAPNIVYKDILRMVSLLST